MLIDRRSWPLTSIWLQGDEFNKSWANGISKMLVARNYGNVLPDYWSETWRIRERIAYKLTGMGSI